MFASPYLPLSSQMLFNIGFYMVVPFLAAHLREDMLLPGAVVGLVLGLRTFAQQGLFVLGGALSDWLGPRRLILCGCLVRIGGFVMLGQADNLPLVIIGACLTGVGGALFSPAIMSLLARLAEIDAAAGRRSRGQWFAMLAVWGEIGAFGGPILAGLITPLGFRGMAHAGAGVFVLAFVLLFILLPRDGAALPPRGRPDWRAMAGDRRFLWFILMQGLQLLCYNQLYFGLPVELARVGGDERDLALMFMIASLLVVGLQLPMSRLTSRLGPVAAVPLGYLTMAAGFAVLAMFAPLPAPSGLWRLAPAAAMVTLLTFGTMLSGPAMAAMVPVFAGERPTGAYFGAAASAGGVMVLVGNIALGPLLDSAGQPQPAGALAWLVLALLPLFAAIAMRRLLRMPGMVAD